VSTCADTIARVQSDKYRRRRSTLQRPTQYRFMAFDQNIHGRKIWCELSNSEYADDKPGSRCLWFSRFIEMKRFCTGELHHVFKHAELRGGEGADHDAPCAKPRQAQPLEPVLFRQVRQPRRNRSCTAGIRSTVNKAQQSVGWVRTHASRLFCIATPAVLAKLCIVRTTLVSREVIAKSKTSGNCRCVSFLAIGFPALSAVS
jgi:hypothetical protein